MRIVAISAESAEKNVVETGDSLHYWEYLVDASSPSTANTAVVFSAVLFLLLMFHLPIVRQRPRRRADELVALFQIMRRGPAVRRPGRVIFDDVRRLSCRRGIAVSSIG
jgi:hypothetical protein